MDHPLDAAPPWGRALLRAILAAEWAILRLAAPWIGSAAAEGLRAAGWVALWEDGEGAWHATLTPWAAERLDVQVESDGRVVWRVVEFEDEGGRKAKVNLKVLEERDRWARRRDVTLDDRPHSQPRAQGFAALPFADRVAAAPAEGEGDEEGREAREEEWTLLGAVVGKLRKPKRSGKRTARRRR